MEEGDDLAIGCVLGRVGGSKRGLDACVLCRIPAARREAVQLVTLIGLNPKITFAGARGVRLAGLKKRYYLAVGGCLSVAGDIPRVHNKVVLYRIPGCAVIPVQGVAIIGVYPKVSHRLTARRARVIKGDNLTVGGILRHLCVI